MEISNMKSYKLNKTFENSVYPIERELKSINNNTLSSTLNNLAAAVFSGIGTSILFQDNCVPKLLNVLYSFLELKEDSLGVGLCNVGAVIVLFIIIYVGGLLNNKHIRNKNEKKNELYKKKRTGKGRSELAEKFHKSIINDIVIGLSFVDKAEELSYEGTVSEMYMYEAVYYFVQAKIQMEEMELLDTEKSESHKKFVEAIGYRTIQSTCMVFNDGLHKLLGKIPEGSEKDVIGTIIDSIKPYVEY